MPIERQRVNVEAFNPAPVLPYELRTLDFESAMQDVYDFFYDVNDFLITRRLPRLEDTLRKAILSGTISDMFTASMAKHSRALVQNCYHNWHPDLIVGGLYPHDRVKAGRRCRDQDDTQKRRGR